MMKEANVTELVVASTGNVAISYSAYSAHAGIKLWTFVPSRVPPEKMREIAIYGSEVVKVTTTYDATKKVAARFAKHKGILVDRGIRNIGTRESMKTIAMEIAEQLTAELGPLQPGVPWRAPDWYIQAVSGGMGPVGVHKGYEELYQMGLVDRIPQNRRDPSSGLRADGKLLSQGIARAGTGAQPRDAGHHHCDRLSRPGLSSSVRHRRRTRGRVRGRHRRGDFPRVARPSQDGGHLHRAGGRDGIWRTFQIAK